MTRVKVVTKTDTKEETPSKPEKIPWQPPKRSSEYRELIKKEWLKKHTDQTTERRQQKKISETLDKNTEHVNLGLKMPANLDLPASVNWNQANVPIRSCSGCFLWILEDVRARMTNIFIMEQLFWDKCKAEQWSQSKPNSPQNRQKLRVLSTGLFYVDLSCFIQYA